MSVAKGKRYPARYHEYARRLYQDGGYTVPEVIEKLAERGVTPARSTVIGWCRPEVRDAHNLKQKRRLYPSGRRKQRQLSWWAKARRARDLRDVGISYSAIAKVLALDFSLDLTAEQVRYALSDPQACRRVFEREAS